MNGWLTLSVVVIVLCLLAAVVRFWPPVPASDQFCGAPVDDPDRITDLTMAQLGHQARPSTAREGGSTESRSAFTGAGGRVLEPLPDGTKSPDSSPAIKSPSYEKYIELRLEFAGTDFAPPRSLYVGMLPRNCRLKLVDRHDRKPSTVAEVVVGTLFDGPQIEVVRPSIEVVSR